MTKQSFSGSEKDTAGCWIFLDITGGFYYFLNN